MLMKKDAFYFPHDSNAKDDPKCVMLIEQLGLEGYGIFWVLVETLRDQPEYKYPLALIPALARRFNTTADKIKIVITNYNLFKVEDDQFFYSESLNRRMELYDRKRENAKLAGKESAKKRLSYTKNTADVQQPFNDCSADVQQPFNDCSADVQQPFNLKEEIKRDKIKLKDIKDKESTEKNFEVVETPPLPLKNKFGAYSHVLMTTDEFHNLVKAAGKDTTLEYITKLDEYIETTGKQYQNHFLVIKKWINKDFEEKYKTKPDSLTTDDRVSAVMNSLSNKPKSDFDLMVEEMSRKEKSA